MRSDRGHPLGVPGASGMGVLEAADSSVGSRSPVTALDRWLIRRVMHTAGKPPIRVALWDGQDAYGSESNPVGRLIFHDRGVLWGVFKSPELAFGDGYSAGRIEIEGDLIEVLLHCYRSIDTLGPSRFKRSVHGRLPRAKTNTPSGSQQHIQHHYDLGNAFYRLWLDESMVYTCAYYRSPAATLEEAQVAKMHHVSRKVRLEPGMSVVEAGCGWGSLALHMARHYGVKVRAFNISREQIAFARDRAQRDGLAGQVEFVEDDYRNMSGQYDAFVSVGMLEHVGLDHFSTLGDVVARTLKRSGLGLIHSVGRSQPTPVNAWLEKRIFPGSCPPSLSEMMAVFEPNQFSVLDIENLRLHYAKTLMAWLARFDRQVDTVREMYDDFFIRAWRLYLAGCAAAFTSSSLQLFQVVFSHRAHNAIAHTREHLYRDDAPDEKWDLS